MTHSRSASRGSADFARRHFLRGMGVAVALPAMPSLVSRRSDANESPGGTTMATTSTGAPLRMAFMSIPNGVQQDHWFPSDDFELNDSMRPLEPLKQHFQVISGLDHVHATPGADGAGDHARANATFLTGARARKTAGSDIHVGVSVDQVAAQKFGHLTRLPSLELTSDIVRNSGACDSGYACAYQYNLSWSSPTTPVTPEPNPRQVFERMFGAGEPSERGTNFLLRQEADRSVLDFVLEEGHDVQRQLGIHDRRKFDEYLSIVREMESRLKSAEKFDQPPTTETSAPRSAPSDFGDYMRMMYDMIVLAFQTDSTRVASLLLAYDGSNRSFPQLGIPEGHHHLTHNQRDEKLAVKVAQIDQFYIQHFADFLEKMSRTEDVDGNSLLHNSMIVYGGAIADGNRHTHENLPVILAGHGGGKVPTGRHLRVPSQPMANLFVTMLDKLGTGVQAIGDSGGPLELPAVT